MKRENKLLRENRMLAYARANDALGLAQQMGEAVPCTCGRRPGEHADDCAQTRLHRAIYAVYDEGHRAGQCREREKIHGKLRSRSGPTGFGLGYGAAAELVARMRFPPVSRASANALREAEAQQRALRAKERERLKGRAKSLHGSEEHFSDVQIARLLGCHKTLARTLREELGLAPHVKRTRKKAGPSA